MKDRLIDAFVAIMVPSPAVFVIGALVVLLVPFLVHYYLVHKTDYSVLPSILLAGTSGSGKTALMVLLERGGGTDRLPQDKIRVPETRPTTTQHSVELSFSHTLLNTSNDDVNEELSLHGRDTTHTRFMLHDTPGALNRRYHALDYIASSAASKTVESAKLKGVVFVVDSADAGQDDSAASGRPGLTAAAEYLYDVLLALQKRMKGGRSSKAPSAVPLLVAANKQDLFGALPAEILKELLEQELTRIRVSRSKGMLESGMGADDVGSEEQDSWLGSYGTEKFTFDQMREFDVDVGVIRGNVVGVVDWKANENAGVNGWWRWMTHVVAP